MDSLNELRIVDGPIAVVCWILGISGMASLCALVVRARRDWRQGLAVVAALVVAAMALTAFIHWLLVDASSVIAENLPNEVLAASGIGVLGVVLAGAAIARVRLQPRMWGRRSLAVASAASTALLSGHLVNAYFGLNPTLADLTGQSLRNIRPFDPLLERSAASAVPLAEWSPPADGLPEFGQLRSVQIPATASGFLARRAYTYFPPAYFAPTRPELPVVLLMAGQPGNPSDWISGGRLKAKLDRFAAGHAGVAPVAVVVDPLGDPAANTLCMDTKFGAAESYLVRDVVPWAKRTLSVAQAPELWATAGFSFGGTCSIQLLAKYPNLFSGALAFAAEEEPSLAKDRSKTIQLGFDGEREAFESQVPARHFASRRYEGRLVYLAAGSNDQDFVRQARVIAEQARSAGAEVRTAVAQGEGHSWQMISKTWAEGIGLLAQRWGIG